MAVNKVLAVICVVQFGIISIWLSTPLSRVPPTAPISLGQNERIPVIESAATLSKQPTTPTPNERPRSPPVGVAAVVMLHSPMWYQRRYTMMLQNVCNNMPRNWVVQVFYIDEGGSQRGLEINPGIRRLLNAGKIVMTKIPQAVWMHKKRRSDYFLIPWLWENMLAEKILLFGGGTVLCSNSLLSVENFTKFDYIGAPWGAFGGRGGSGELSIRSKSVMLEAINMQLAKNNITRDFTNEWGLEDSFYVKSIIEFIKAGRPLKLASKEDTKIFAASNSHGDLTVFGASGTLAGLSDKERENFFSYCPEIKVIFPSLHNPGCFGANLKRDQCKESICALNPNKKSC